MVLIGNKADLEEERKVKKEEALEVAKEFNLAYLETSALNAQNIDIAFETIAKGKKKENEYWENKNDAKISIGIIDKVIMEKSEII